MRPVGSSRRMMANLIQIGNASSLSALLFVVSSGFTLIFGLLRVVNLAHGSLYLLGGYLGMTVARSTGSFFLGICSALVAIAVLGLLLDRVLLERIRNQELRQVLLTLGVAFVINDICLVIWGGDALSVPVPATLRGAANLGGIFYPKYRLFMIGSGIVIFILLWLLYNRTRLGALIRAGVDDKEMAEAIGIRISRLFMFTVMLGSALAGIGGVLGGAFLTLYPGADTDILVFSLAIVIIGGQGSLGGAALASLFVGFLATFGQVWFPQLAYFIIFGPMALLLAFRPYGLFGRA